MSDDRWSYQIPEDKLREIVDMFNTEYHPSSEIRDQDQPLVKVRSCGPFMTGFVSEIHGKGGTEVPGYPLTRNELEVLAKYHIREHYDISLTQFAVGGACNTD